MTPLLIAQIVLTLFVFFMLLNSAAIMVYVERKVAAFIQQRLGPYLVGPRGLLQPLADIVKLMFKEELRPRAADPRLFALAPIISATCAFAAFAVVPFGAETTFFGLLNEPISLQVADVNVAILVIFAVASMGVYGIVLAGWGSNSKYSLLGGRRLVRTSATLVRLPAARGLHHFPDRRRRGNQPRPVRFSRGRAGARGRLPHRIQQHELRHVLHGGVHQHGHGLGRRDGSLPRRM